MEMACAWSFETMTFDLGPDNLRFESVAVHKFSERGVPYEYFGGYLVGLYDALVISTPWGWAQESFERKSGAKYVRMATLIGLFPCRNPRHGMFCSRRPPSMGFIPAVEKSSRGRW